MQSVSQRELVEEILCAFASGISVFRDWDFTYVSVVLFRYVSRLFGLEGLFGLMRPRISVGCAGCGLVCRSCSCIIVSRDVDGRGVRVSGDVHDALVMVDSWVAQAGGKVIVHW